MRTRVLRTKPEAGPAGPPAGPPAAGPAGPPAAARVVRTFPACANARARAGDDVPWGDVPWGVVQPPAPPGALRERLPPRKLGLAPAAAGAPPALGAPRARWDDRALERAAELLCLLREKDLHAPKGRSRAPVRG
jgi:hypothetical protein